MAQATDATPQGFSLLELLLGIFPACFPGNRIPGFRSFDLAGSKQVWSRLPSSSCFLSFQLSFQHKIGILYCKAGQSTEEEMYNNETAGPAFEEFLDLLGQRVRLKGFSKYRAQLDNKSKHVGTCTLLYVYAHVHANSLCVHLCSFSLCVSFCVFIYI